MLVNAFEVDAVLLGELTGILTGSGSPAVDLIVAPQGSLYLQSDGSVWRKYGALDNEWTAFAQGGPGSVVEAPIVDALTTNFTTTSTAFVPTGLEVTLEANAPYWIGGHILFSSAAANNGVGLAFDFVGAVPTAFGALTIIPTGNSSTVVNVTQYQLGTATISGAVGTAGRLYFASSNGVILTSTTGGTLSMLARSETTSGITIHAGSSIKAEKRA